jgi:hypothetical protein
MSDTRADLKLLPSFSKFCFVTNINKVGWIILSDMNVSCCNFLALNSVKVLQMDLTDVESKELLNKPSI